VYAWWNLSRTKKRVLQDRRHGEEYGGETAIGVGKAPYFWSQEYGNPRAAIEPQMFVTRTWASFQSKMEPIIKDTVRSKLGT
jgi:hypothetical protein